MTHIITGLVIPVLTLIGAAVGGGITIYIYYRNSRLRRAEWLYSLFEKFFCGTSYARIRMILDYESPEDIKGLQRALETHSDPELEEAMVDYLNFFEFVASLHQLRQLTTQEVRMVFDYYIRRLGDHPFVMTYLIEPKQGFEGLVRLVHEVRSQAGKS